MEEKKTGRVKAELLSWGKTLLAAVIIALLINQFLIVNALVPSGSMEATVHTGDRVLGNRLAYLFHEPERYDIVVFDHDADDDGVVRYFKRILGLPGETLEVLDGKVYVNGAPEPLRDDFVRETPQGDFGPFEIPEGCYLMMGDNRNSSYDSRRWKNSYVERGSILGKALLVYYPDPRVLENID